MMRLDRILAHCGFGTRKDVKELIRSKVVSVNGQIVSKDDCKVNENTDQIVVEGQPVLYQQYVYYMLYKPQGVVSATQDRQFPTVLDCLETSRSDLFPVGRLDIDTEGLLLITNDGKLSHELLTPKNHVNKVYEVTLENEFDLSFISEIEKGIAINDNEVCLPAKVEVLSKTFLHLTIQEGKYHQIKRMMHACNNEVIFLKRISMGKLMLDPQLSPGEFRDLTVEELDSLRQR